VNFSEKFSENLKEVFGGTHRAQPITCGAASMTLKKPRKTFESSTAFIKATQIKRDESDSQSLTENL